MGEVRDTRSTYSKQKPTAEFGDLNEPFNYTEVTFEVPNVTTNTRVITTFKRTADKRFFPHGSIGWRKQILNHINIAVKSLEVVRCRCLEYRKDVQRSATNISELYIFELKLQVHRILKIYLADILGHAPSSSANSQRAMR